MVLPLVLLVNLYRFVMFDDSEFVFKGFSYIHKYIGTFPGLSMTFNTIDNIQSTATSFENIRVESILDVFDALNHIMSMIGLAFSLPIMIIIDVARDIWWTIGILWGN